MFTLYLEIFVPLLLLIVPGIIKLRSGWLLRRQIIQLLRYDIEITGTLVRLLSRTTNRGGKRFFAEYSYSYAGTPHTHIQRINEEHYNAWYEGISLPVLILPENPKIAYLAEEHFVREWHNPFLYGYWSLVGGIFALIVNVVFFFFPKNIYGVWGIVLPCSSVSCLLFVFFVGVLVVRSLKISESV